MIERENSITHFAASDLRSTSQNVNRPVVSELNRSPRSGPYPGLDRKLARLKSMLSLPETLNIRGENKPPHRFANARRRGPDGRWPLVANPIVRRISWRWCDEDQARGAGRSLAHNRCRDSLLVPQSFNRVQLGCSKGRVQAKENSDPNRDQKRQTKWPK